METLNDIAYLYRIEKYLLDHCRVHYGFSPNDRLTLTHDAVKFDLYLCWNRMFSIHTETVISNEFGFIKYLIDSDKIETDAYKTVYSGDLDKRKTLVESRDGEEIYNVTEHGVYESLLMLLSIQDNPISFLVSILK